MDKLNEVIKRLERQYKIYEEERDSDDEDGIIDVSLACRLADSIPYLIKTIKQQKELIRELEGSVGWHINAVKRYEKALNEILDEGYEEDGIHPYTDMQLDTFIIKTARKALES